MDPTQKLGVTGLPLRRTQPDNLVSQDRAGSRSSLDHLIVAEKISVLLKDSELCKEMGKKGREICLERFTIEEFWRNIEESFMSVV
jgi:hypothetical protein